MRNLVTDTDMINFKLSEALHTLFSTSENTLDTAIT